MASIRLRLIVSVCGGVGALLAAIPTAHAGGFAIREMSSYGQATSYAGVAAGGDLSTMFWNPATLTQVPGVQIEAAATGIFPYAANNPTAGTFVGLLPGTGNTADNAFVPSGYFSYQLNPSLWLGMSINAPFGLSVSFPDLWAGRDYAAGDTSLRTYNATPSIAYRINDWISVGFGVQIEYAQASLVKGITVPGPGFYELNVSGNGWGYGFTAGATLTPTPTTTVGVGYRSAVNQKIDGSLLLNAPLPGSTLGPVSTTLDLPDMVSLGVRQQVGPQWTLLGTVEWTNWSRIGTSVVNQANGAPATILAGFGGGEVVLPFQYKDGWLFSAGAQYQWNDKLALRGGVGYEKSPITDQVRIPLLPDNDRFWLSGGMTYHFNPRLAFDFAYSHLFVKNTPINVSAASGNPWFDGVTYIGDVAAHIDIVSLALKYRWDDGATASEKKLYTK